jgi:CHAT domain-containing protein/Tfp pilus assembly protein PilF
MLSIGAVSNVHMISLNDKFKFSLPGLIILLIVMACPIRVIAQAGLDKTRGIDGDISLMTAKADSLIRTGQIDSALTLAQSALSDARKDLSPGDTILAYVLNVIGKAHYYKADYAKCKLSWQESYEIRIKTLGVESEAVAASLNNLGALAKTVGDFPLAESLYVQMLAIRRRVQGDGHPDLAGGFNNLASLYRIEGKFAEAEPLYRKALAINEKDAGPDHPATAGCLNNLGILYDEQGRYDMAEEYYRRALSIWRNTLGEMHPQVAAGLNNLAGLYYNTGKFAQAESLYQKALAIRGEIYGPDHLSLTSSMNNLGVLYMEYGDYEKAEPLLIRSLSIKENTLPPDHPMIASSCDNLATLYYNQGIYGKAEEYESRALDIFERSYGENHPYTAACRLNLGSIYAASGDFAEGLIEYREVQKSRHDFIDDVFSYASEVQKLKYVHKYPVIDNKLLSLAMLTGSDSAKSAAFEMVLKGKAAVIDAMCAEKEFVLKSGSENDKAQIKTWSNICGQLSNLMLGGAESLKPEVYSQRIDSLYAVKDSIELAMSQKSAEFAQKLEARKFSPEKLSMVMPDNSVLWEIIQYRPYDFAGAGSEKHRTGKPEYAAFIYHKSGTLTFINLGDASEINRLIHQARQAIYYAPSEIYEINELQAEMRFKVIARKLYDRLFEPLISRSDNPDRIFLAPDGQLNLLPFDILANADGKYVVENYSVSYVSSGRDFSKFAAVNELEKNVIIIANPDFNFSGGTDSGRNKEGKTVPASDVTILSRGTAVPLACLKYRFSSLPDTEREAEFLGDLFGSKSGYKVILHESARASEENLKNIPANPAILHLATHGFFCMHDSTGSETFLTNPLVRSGLALAGANDFRERDRQGSSDIGENGILTAFEASGLPLRRTTLVTLSACETGLGEIEEGEGVFGLRRAFQYAGARSLLMTLWKVPGTETSDLMEEFYSQWLDGLTKAEALRKSVLSIIKKRREQTNSAHPYFWGAFVLFGNPY